MNDLQDNTFFAQITVNLNGRTLKIDSRPSDAIALAVRANATIFVEDHVMAAASITPETDVTEDVDDEDYKPADNHELCLVNPHSERYPPERGIQELAHNLCRNICCRENKENL